MRLIYTFFVLLFTFTTTAQTPEEILQKVQEKYTPEKIYIHYDKASYIAGETIWFKAYVMEGIYPTNKSTILKLALINSEGLVVQQKLLPIVGGAAVGEFTLDKLLPEGTYTIKANTTFMQNFGYEKFYYKEINIYNPVQKSNIQKIENETFIYFLPEAGNLVANVKNTLAVKCTDKKGNPLNTTGSIVDSKGIEVQSFKTVHDGMGKFEFKPKFGEEYKAICTVNGIIKKEVNLPKSEEQGVAMKVTNEKDKLNFLIDASTIKNTNLIPSYILGVEENMVAFKLPLSSTNKIINAAVPLTQLTTGIMQLTVFNANHQPLAERLVFINTGDYLPKGNLIPTKIGLGIREKNSFTYNIPDTLSGTFSVAVVAMKNEPKNEDNIVSHLLLTSDIKGKINNPAYYFESNNAEHIEHLDLVMLTNGWTKYTWKELMSNRFPSMAFTDPNFVTLKGTAYNPSDGAVLVNKPLTVIVKTKDEKVDFLSTTTNEKGLFELAGMTFEDTAIFVIQSPITKNKKVNTTISSDKISNTLFSNQTKIPVTYFELPTAEKLAEINASYNFNKNGAYKGLLLDEIKIQSRVKSEKEKYEQKYVTGRLGSMANKEIDLLKDPPKSFLNIFDYMGGRVNGVRVTGGPLDYQVIYRNASSLMGGPIPMNIFLDEFQVEASQIATLKIQDVALIKIFGMGGMTGGAGGTLAIYTKKGDGGNTANNPIHAEQMVEGFTVTKEFFSPQYDSDKENDILLDDRTTLYWNPYLNLTKDKNNFSFSFFNTDKPKKYKIVLEGFFEDGKLLHIEKVVE